MRRLHPLLIVLFAATAFAPACDSGSTNHPDEIPDDELGEGKLGSGGGGGIAGVTSGMGSKKVDPRVQKAEQLIAAGQASQAIDELGAAIEAEQPGPLQATFHYVRGNAYSYLDKDSEARKDYDRAIEIDDGQYRAHAAIGSLIAFGEGRLQPSIPYFQKALQIEPAFADGHHSLGVVLYDLGRFEDAIKSLETARELPPLNVDTLFILAQAYAKAGRMEEGVATIADAVKAEPGEAGADLRVLEGRLRNELGQTQDAIRAFERAAKVAPDAPALQLQVVRGLLTCGAPDKALPIMERLVDKLPDEPAVIINHGRVLAALKKLDGKEGALARFETALAKDPKLPAAHRHLIATLADAGRCKKARAAMARFRKTDPKPRDLERVIEGLAPCE